MPLSEVRTATVNWESAVSEFRYLRERECAYIVTPNAVGDPLLLAIDDVVFAILAELGFAGEVRHVAAGIRLSDCQTDTFVAAQDLGNNAVDESRLAMFDKRRATNAKPSDHVPDEPTGA